MSSDDPKIRVLFVDDERFVLEAIKRTVRKIFDATFAEGGPAALDILRSDTEPFAVLCTDMRMPSVDGLAVLKAFRAEAPDTTRVLLTGQADLDAAVAAVNLGSVFRFLTKPTDPDQLQATILEAAELFRLRHAEREILEQTLHGSVQALSETLSLANPVAFARAQRLRNLVDSMLDHLDVANRWEIEVAVMLSQVGAVTLPPQISERLNSGETLTDDEQQMVDEMAPIADRLLAGIPRLESVRRVILLQPQWSEPDSPIGTKLLHLASEIDSLTARGLEPAVIKAQLSAYAPSYGDDVMSALDAWVTKGRSGAASVRMVPLASLRIGMRLAADVVSKDGLLLVGRGQEVGESLLVRIRNFERTAGLAEDLFAVQDIS
jgi:ActR/RegA family two-component response regulator